MTNIESETKPTHKLFSDAKYVAWGTDFALGGFWVGLWDETDGPASPQTTYDSDQLEDALAHAKRMAAELKLDVWEVDEHGPLKHCRVA